MENGANEDRRKYIRIKKNFILSFYDKSDPDVRHIITQLKNISHGGMCFITSRYYKPGITMGIDMKTPFLAGTIHLDGTVLGCHEKVPNVIYETRIVFSILDPEVEFILDKIVDYFKEGKPENHE